MKLWKYLALAAFVASASVAHAGKLAGKNIILIQGFQPQHVFLKRTDDGGKRWGYAYWNKFELYNNGDGAIKTAPVYDESVWYEYIPAIGDIQFLDQVLPVLEDNNGNTFNMYDHTKTAVFYDDDPHAKILYFDSTYRLEEAGGQGNGAKVAQQLKDLFAADPTYCARTNGCIVITHSTGDIVMRWIEANKHTALDDATRQAFDVLTYVDMAGAGGGTEGATLLYWAANLANALTPSEQDDLDLANYWINTLFGTEGVLYMEAGKHFNAGILFDLQVHEARNADRSNPDEIPKLRIASAGDEPYGFITHAFIKGRDDSVLPLHSTCGSANAHAYDSCSHARDLNGKVTLFNDAPLFFYRHNYPFIQSEDLRHNGHQWNDTGNTMVALMGDGQVAPGVRIDIEETTSWWLLNQYKRITNSENSSMAEVLSRSIEQ
ncbi:MAG: hypothetical protein R3183_04340 [Oleiphilaceae bacterium]|nr:hypothetical protein [Oleiphilaceae bacterium]